MDANRPLAGIKVLELARVLAGPWIGQTLADLGADVIKVESPTGDETRGWGKPVTGDGTAAYFMAANRGKRSIALDFRNADDLALVRQMAAGADIVLENFKVGSLVKFGLDYPSMTGDNPGLIYASVTGFGQDGPYAKRAGYDFIIQAMGGIMDLTGEPDGPPSKPGVAYADLFTGMYGTVAVLAALEMRHRTGRGQWIDLSLFDTQLAVLANQATDHLVGGRDPHRMGNTHPSIVPYQVFEASDGPLVIACGNDGQFARACEGLGLTLHQNPEYRTNVDRMENREALAGLLSVRIAEFTRAEVLEAMEARGVPAGPINSVAEAFADPQATARGMVEQVGDMRLPRSPMRFSDAATGGLSAPPSLNQDGADIREKLAAGVVWPD